MAKKMTLDAREARITKLKAELEVAEREHDRAADAELLTVAHALGTRRALQLVRAALAGDGDESARTVTVARAVPCPAGTAH